MLGNFAINDDSSFAETASWKPDTPFACHHVETHAPAVQKVGCSFEGGRARAVQVGG